MTTAEKLEKMIPRDEEYYYLLATDDWLKKDHLSRKDKKIITRKEEEGIREWLDMSSIERKIFINRVLYEYWTEVATNYKTFWAYKNFMKANADRIQLKQQESHKSHHSHSSASSCIRPHSRLEAYRVLGLEWGADKQQIKEAHRRLVKQKHPDVGGDAKEFINIQEAYEILSRKEAS
jgi:hypothetical protein